ncbi:hypothetical protein A1O3_06533 [Capronia epimyces CBS 606.96]|uniref:SP-RING-type domain-containing protein n=1 Tax=Capronia epimyces CBS 606.96 TaxID=1182542 RepID=W9YKC5_9EURO|nr:uncharacterized protein A1O3_06533 [Capronia epimyces CBS 606.96]EXJ82719.1 hypothetical protein A1O3_06533 [Capronia epimyces CBS 606.96]
MASTTFEPQPLAAPLDDRSLALLEDLVSRDRPLGVREKKLHDFLVTAVDQLTEVTGKLNDRAYERRVRHERERARRRQQQQQQQQQEDGGDVDTSTNDDEAEVAHEQFQQKVETLTAKMDLSIRAIIDDQVWLEGLPAALRHVVTAARNAASETQQMQTQPTPSPTPVQSTGRSPDDGHNDDASGRERKPATQRQPTAVQPSETPHELLAAALQEQSREWASKTLTERYAHNNDYKGFYRVLYDAKHPGEAAPPMPNERLWFAAEEGRELISTQQRSRHDSGRDEEGDEENDNDDDDDDDDDEIEIASERVRIKCPITLLPYVDPVTSLRCNHSYEKSAIQSMLETAQDHAPFTPEQLAELDRLDRRDRPRRERQMRVPQVKCPECNLPLTAADLKPNPALRRRVQRLLESARRNQERDIATSDVDQDDEEDDAEDMVRGTQRRPVGLGSSPVPPSSAATRRSVREAKRERPSSVIPQTQLSRPGTAPSGTPSRLRHAASARPRSAILDVEEDDLA